MWMVECLHVAGRILSFVSVNETSMFRASSGQSREAVRYEGLLSNFSFQRSGKAGDEGLFTVRFCICCSLFFLC